MLCAGLLCLGVTAMIGMPADASPDGFTYTLPAGWQALDLKNTPFTLRAAASPAGDAAAAFSVLDVSSVLPPDRYVQHLLGTLKESAPQTRLFSRGPFITASGLHGYRAVFDEIAPGSSVHFVVCIFSGPGRHKLLAAGLWPASDTAHYEAAVNQSLKTFTLK